jgi:hypothetical protein
VNNADFNITTPKSDDGGGGRKGNNGPLFFFVYFECGTFIALVEFFLTSRIKNL